MAPANTLLAAGFEGVFTIAVILISLIGWVVNLVNEKQKQKQNQPRQRGGRDGDAQPAGRDDRFQSEIDMFLQDVKGQQAPADIQIEVVPDHEIRVRQQREPGSRELGTLSQRSLSDRHLVSSVGSEVDQHMDSDSVGSHVAEALDDDFEVELVDAPRGKAAPAMRSSTVAEMLRNPDDIRKAILVSEILAPCRSLRSRQSK